MIERVDEFDQGLFDRSQLNGAGLVDVYELIANSSASPAPIPLGLISRQLENNILSA